MLFRHIQRHLSTPPSVWPLRQLPWQPSYYYKKIQSRKAKGRLKSNSGEVLEFPRNSTLLENGMAIREKSVFFFFFSPPSFLFSWMSQPANALLRWGGPGTRFNPKDWAAFEPVRVKPRVLPWADTICLLINNAHRALIICWALYLQAIHVLSHSSQQLSELSTTLIPILQRNKLRLRHVQSLAHSLPALGHRRGSSAWIRGQIPNPRL